MPAADPALPAFIFIVHVSSCRYFDEAYQEAKQVSNLRHTAMSSDAAHISAHSHDVRSHTNALPPAAGHNRGADYV
jgi:hypothetical protein